MKAFFIDYSEPYYADVAKTATQGTRGGKFVQIRHNDTEYLILSPKELTPYHADIVERFCREKGIDGSYTGEGKRFDIRDAGWTIVGGGKFEIDKRKGYIRFSGDSMAYGKFDARGLREEIFQVGDLKGYEVRIE